MADIRTYSISSSDDDAPLRDIVVSKRKSSDDYEVNSYEALHNRMRQPCDFCEHVFFNRYSSIIHNASHIIIPLIKQPVHRCNECLFVFTSKSELNRHVATKHIDKIEPVITVDDLLEDSIQETSFNGLIESEAENEMYLNEVLDYSKYESDALEIVRGIDLESLFHIKDTDLTTINNSFNEDGEFPTINPNFNLVEDSYATISKNVNVKSEIVNVKSEIVKDVKDESEIVKDVNVKSEIVKDESVNKLSIKSRLTFEEDCLETALSTEMAVINKFMTNEDATSDSKSIHYDDLMRPGLFVCKLCSKTYPNRYQLIKHEGSHIRLKSRPFYCLCFFCDRYVSGNIHILRKHIQIYHNNEDAYAEKPFINNRCRKCHLIYHRKRRHDSLYHSADSGQDCEIMNNSDSVGSNKVNIEFITVDLVTNTSGSDSDKIRGKVKEICDLCFYFLKKTLNALWRYRFCGLREVMGQRQSCDNCKKQCFQLNVVYTYRFLYPKKEASLKTDGQPKEKLIKQFHSKHKVAKHKTNESRLQNIQQRLKTLKGLNK